MGKLHLISGSFENGCGVTVWDKSTDKMYVKVVYKNAIEINGRLYSKEDIVIKW